VQPLVDLEFLAEEKSLVTVGALERLVTAVYLTVLAKCTLVHKRTSTDVTCVGPLPRVKSYVTQQVAACRELPTASLAVERRISGVTVAVHS